MSISWPWQCLGPSLSRCLPAELRVPAGTGEIPAVHKRRVSASTAWCVHFGGGRLAALVLPSGQRRHFSAGMSLRGAVGGSQFGTGVSAGPPDSTKEYAVCDTIGALGWGQGQGQAREGSCSWCPNTPVNMHCHSSFFS